MRRAKVRGAPAGGRVEGLIAVTYRCNARCTMCGTWRQRCDTDGEIEPRHLESLPAMRFANVTGGEPFLRRDLADLVRVVRAKARRVVISTNGYLTEPIVGLARRFPDLGFRVSIEGLPAANDELRGMRDGFDHAVRTLLRLRALGVRDIGFGITVSDRNAEDLLELYELARSMRMEFATAVVHNGYYFHKHDNVIDRRDEVAGGFEELAARLLGERDPKSWFRAWFNMGLANRVRGGPRPLPCRMGHDVFFVDPAGDVKPCNVMDETMGSLARSTFDEVWRSGRAEEVRRLVRGCREQCWMVGSVAPAMRDYIRVPASWVLRAKLSRGVPAVGGG